MDITFKISNSNVDGADIFNSLQVSLSKGFDECSIFIAVDSSCYTLIGQEMRNRYWSKWNYPNPYLTDDNVDICTECATNDDTISDINWWDY